MRRDVSPIGPDDPGSGFTCGKHALDRFFAKHALSNDSLGVGKTWVLRQDGADPSLPRVLGYYTLALSVIESLVVSPLTGASYPRAELGVCLIGKFAIDKRCHRRGLGSELLADALDRSLRVSAEVGGVGVVLHAKDADARAFYQAFRFQEVPPKQGADPEAWPRHMFITLSEIRAALS